MRSLQPVHVNPHDLVAPSKAVTPIESPDVGIDDPIVIEAEAMDSLRRQGCVLVKNEIISDIARLGIHLKGVGVLRFHRGQSLVIQVRANEAMMRITEQMERVSGSELKSKEKTRQLVELSTALSRLSKSVTDSQKLSLETEKTMSPGQQDYEPTTRKSFAAGQAIQPIQIVSAVTHVGAQGDDTKK